jgi:hypothetical protein
MLSLTQPLQLKTEVYKTIMPGGVTSPLLVDASDATGKMYTVVLKLYNPGIPNGHGHYGKTSLACELICAVIAKALNLSIPEYAIVEVPSNFWQTFRGDKAKDLLKNSPGKNFGTVYKEGSYSWQMDDETLKGSKFLAIYENILSFDSAIYNDDRRCDRPNLLVQNSDIFIIDHSLALPAHQWNYNRIEVSSLLDESKIAKHSLFPVLKGKKRIFNKLFKKWEHLKTQISFDEVRALIPREWQVTQRDVDKIFDFLENRHVQFQNMTNNLRSQTR